MAKQAKAASLGIKVRFEGPNLKVTGRVRKGDNAEETAAIMMLQEVFTDFLENLFKAGKVNEGDGDKSGLRNEPEGSTVS